MTKVLLRVACIIGLISTAAPTWAGTILILSSENAGAFHRGQTFDGAREISIPSGGRLVLMDERAVVVTLNGPYVGIPGGGLRDTGPTFLERLAALLTPAKSGEDRTVLGATRAFGSPEDRADPWAISLTGGGSVCVRAERAPEFWRPAPRPASMLTLNESGGTAVKVTWAADQVALPWPTSLPIVTGKTYTVTEDSSGSTRTFVARVSPTPLETEIAALEWLVLSGCTTQLEATLASLTGRRVIEGPRATGMAVFE